MCVKGVVLDPRGLSRERSVVDRGSRSIPFLLHHPRPLSLLLEDGGNGETSGEEMGPYNLFKSLVLVPFSVTIGDRGHEVVSFSLVGMM